MARVMCSSAPAGVLAALLTAAAALPATAVTITTVIGVADESGLGPDDAFGWAAGAPAGGDAFVDGAHLAPGGFPELINTGQGEADVRVEQISSQTVDYTFFFGPGPDTDPHPILSNGRVTTFVEFVASSTTSLWLMDYDAHDDAGERSLMVFERHGEGGVESLTNDFETCYKAAPRAFGADWCDVISAVPEGGVELFSDLAGGVYRLGIFDGSLPQRGSATFRVTSAPAPMAGLMLLSAFGVWRVASRQGDSW
ncbi:MAG: hypothetical protein AAF763_12560 [Pseudomonadota bacterium]